MEAKVAKYTNTDIHDVKKIELEPWLDDRGVFVEALSASSGHPVKQINKAKNEKAGTVRGMHWQAEPAAQVKIVYSVVGRLLDIAVDVRKDSPTYGRVVCLELFPFVNALYIPSGIAHGCQALDDGATMMYLLDAAYSPKHERGFRVDDPIVRDLWPLAMVNVAPRDLNWPLMRDLL